MNDFLSHALLHVGEITVTVGGVIAAVAAVIGSMVLSAVLRRGIDVLAQRRGTMDPASVYTVKRMLHYFLVVVGVLTGLSLLGFNLNKLAILAGALGVGIGFGLQNIVNNFVSGIIILFERTLKVGDFVELSSGLRGEVLAIHIRNTVVRTPDNIEVIIPNSEFVNNPVTNWTFTDSICRLRIPFGVAYGSDKSRVRDAVLALARENPFTLPETSDRKPSVLMTGFGDSSLDFLLAVWVRPEAVKRPAEVISSYLWAIDDAFRAQGIEVPFPQRDLHLRSSRAAIQFESVSGQGMSTDR